MDQNNANPQGKDFGGCQGIFGGYFPSRGFLYGVLITVKACQAHLTGSKGLFRADAEVTRSLRLKVPWLARHPGKLLGSSWDRSWESSWVAPGKQTNKCFFIDKKHTCSMFVFLLTDSVCFGLSCLMFLSMESP